jgi:hypothetical protein
MREIYMTLTFTVSNASRRRLISRFLACICAAAVPACVAPGGEDPAGAEQADTITAGVADGGSTASAEPPDSEFVDTPLGPVHQSCVHGVGDGATIDASDRVTMRDGTSVHFGPCKFQPRARLGLNAARAMSGSRNGGVVPVTDGWAEFDAAFAPGNAWGYDWINGLTGTWQVPLAPRQYTNQTVFLFNGAEPSDGSAIIQPVLQYGTSRAGGGNFWSMAAWYLASSGNVFFSTLQRVNVGDTIQGSMFASNCSSSGACTWAISAFNGSVGTSLNVGAGETFRWVPKGVLEVYRITNCNKLPTEGDTGATFSNTHVYMPGPNVFNFNDATSSMPWSGTTMAEGCSFGVIDTADGVQLFWD